MGRPSEALPAGVAELAAQVAGHLLSGLPLDAASLETLCQLQGQPDPLLALAALDADPESSDCASARALVLSPGPETRLALEPALARAELDAGGAGRLARETARLLAAAGGRVVVLLPGGAQTGLAAAPWEVEGCVRRLRPEATAPAELRRLLDQRWPGPGPEESSALALDLCLALRLCRLVWTPARVFVLSTLLERAPEAEARELTDWVLGFLDLAGQEFDPREAFRARRQALLEHLRLAGFQEQAQAGSSFEVRLSQGQRPGHVHGPEVAASLALLDRACRLVLGVPGASLTDVCVRDLGEAADPEALLRVLKDAAPGG